MARRRRAQRNPLADQLAAAFFQDFLLRQRQKIDDERQRQMSQEAARYNTVQGLIPGLISGTLHPRQIPPELAAEIPFDLSRFRPTDAALAGPLQAQITEATSSAAVPSEADIVSYFKNKAMNIAPQPGSFVAAAPSAEAAPPAAGGALLSELPSKNLSMVRPPALEAAMRQREERRAGLLGEEQHRADVEMQKAAEQQRLQAEFSPLDFLSQNAKGEPVRKVGTLQELRGEHPAFEPQSGYNLTPVQTYTIGSEGVAVPVTTFVDPRNGPPTLPMPPAPAVAEEERFFMEVLRDLDEIEKGLPANQALLGPLASNFARLGGNVPVGGSSRKLLERMIGQPLTPASFQFITAALRGRQSVTRRQAGLAQTATEFQRVKETFPNLTSQPDAFVANLAATKDATIRGLNVLRSMSGRPPLPLPGQSPLERARQRR